MGPSPHLWFLNANQRLLDRNNKSLWVPNMTCRFVHAKQRDQHLNYLSLWVPALICGFCMQNSDCRTRLKSLYGSQTSSVVFACKTATFGSDWQISMGPSPRLWFLEAKQRLFRQNNESLWVQALICGFCMQNSDFRTRLTSLYGSLTSSVVMSTHNSVLSPRIKRLYGFQPSRVVLGMQISDFSTWITSLCWFQPSSVVVCLQNNDLRTKIAHLWVPDLTCDFLHAKQCA